MERNSHKGSFASLNTPDTANLSRSHDGLHTGNTQLPFTFWTSLFTAMLQIADRHSEENIRVDALSIMILIARTSDPKVEREKFGFTSVMEKLHQLLQKENGLLVKKHSVDLLFLLLNCPTTLKLLCNGGKDSPEQIEAIRCENDRSQQAFRLHRINMSRFFYPQPEPPPADANAMVDARLPRPTMSLYAPSSSSEHYDGSMHFMLLGHDRVLATDQTGHAAIYDAAAHAMRTAPAFTKPKEDPVSVAVGDDTLYVLDTSPRPDDPCFEALVYERGLCTETWDDEYYDGWRCHPLPPGPFPRDFSGAVSAYTVVGGSDIWISTNEGCTYSFDTARRAWAKLGDWTLPSHGLAEYVPEYNLWFGLFSSSNNTNHLCAFDLAGAAKRQSPPARRNVWEDLKPPKDWSPLTSYLVHLGSGRFCVARLFIKTEKNPRVRQGYKKHVPSRFHRRRGEALR